MLEVEGVMLGDCVEAFAVLSVETKKIFVHKSPEEIKKRTILIIITCKATKTKLFGLVSYIL